jgi:DNA-directed RNA polymerase specialized sigma24 family protein
MAEDAREDRARAPPTQGNQDLRPLLLSIAYGIVGSVSEAADIVQKAFLHCTGNRVRMPTRLAQGLAVHGHDAAGAIDQLRSGATRAA